VPSGVAFAGGAAFNNPTNLPNACGGNGCWTNYLRVTDLDGDDQLDIVTVNMQGLFDVGPGEPLAVYLNDPPGAFDNASNEAVGGHEGQHRQVAIGDIDGDGDPDMYAPDANGNPDMLFVNDGSATFEAVEQTVSSQAGAARFGDVDDDGDLDLFLTGEYPGTAEGVSPAGFVYLNDGAGAFTELADATPPMIGGSQPIDVDLFDANGDFVLDALIDTHSGPLSLWLGDGTGAFTESDTLANSPGLHYGPGVCDVDGDGDLDFWVDNAGPDYTEQLQINDGAGTFTDETAARVSDNPGSDDNGVVCVDFDYDGDWDAIVVALGTPERYLQNDGTGNFTYVPGVIPGSGDSTLWAELGDVDNDGRLDIVTGSGEGATIDRFYIANDQIMPDTTGPGFRVVEQAEAVDLDTPLLIHFAVTDSTVTDEGPRLDRAFVRVALDGGDPVEVDAWFMGGDLFRVELPGQATAGTVSYTACAIDLAGNEGCADPLEYDVGDTGGTTGGSDTGDDATATGPDSADTSAGPGTASSDSMTASGTVSATMTGGSDTEDSADSGDSGANDDGGGGGCACDVDSHRGSGLAFAAVGLLALARRRRSAKR
jgi:MYXO-CTERM domain-containing protein